MKRGASLRAAAGVLVYANALAAQTLPVPALPAPAEPPEATAARGRSWEYALGAGLGWDSNLDFLIPNGPSSAAVTPRGGLARVFWNPRGQWRATAAGGAVGYPQQRELHRWSSELGLEGTHRLSPGAEWRANASYGFGYADSTRILLEQGVLLPLVAKTRSVAGGLGFTRRMGTHKSMRIDARYYRTEFDTPLLVTGQSARATFGLERKLSMRSSAGIEYSLEHVLSDQVGRTYLTHYGSFQWTSVLSQRSALLVEAGASFTPDAARAGLERKENFFGGASFSRQLGRSGLRLFVRREVTPAFGIGKSRVELRAGLGANVPMGHDWELRILASHVQPETRRADDLAYPSNDDAFAALGRRLGRHVELSLEARYRRRWKTSTLPLVEAVQAGLFVTLLSPSWKSIAPAAAR